MNRCRWKNSSAGVETWELSQTGRVDRSRLASGTAQIEEAIPEGRLKTSQPIGSRLPSLNNMAIGQGDSQATFSHAENAFSNI